MDTKEPNGATVCLNNYITEVAGVVVVQGKKVQLGVAQGQPGENHRGEKRSMLCGEVGLGVSFPCHLYDTYTQAL